jgi:hypothetical protein
MTREGRDDLPIHRPLPCAVEGGVFGRDESGGLRPDRSQVRALTKEHVLEMAAVLECLRRIERRVAADLDPTTGRRPRGRAGAKRVERADEDVAELTGRYEDLLAAYAEGFGDRAAEEIDQVVRGRVASDRRPASGKTLF